MNNNELATLRAQLFPGQPGEPVPEVDPEDIKAVGRAYQDAAKDNPGLRGLDLRVLERVCKPGADIHAVYYRQASLDLLRLLSSPSQQKLSEVAQQQFSEFQARITALMTDGAFRDAAFRAIAKVPMKWPGVGIVRQDPHFLEEFLKLCNEP
jgi:hypothetical protein